ncbi:hypothetical protein [Cohnella sp. GCM10012308]|uniref:hypothetical protein n=1 Tax=Cohnella sp. GCM10012308 TaxID=3317329 RepID=UPI003617C1E8
MIPFRNSLPYDIQMNEVYASECPFCGQSHVRMPMKPEELDQLRGGLMKRTIVMPCCRSRLQLVDADSDYLLANKPLRA